MATRSRKGSKKVKPRKPKPKKLSVDQIVARQLKGDWETIAQDEQRIGILDEYFKQTVKLAWAVWKIMRDELNYFPGEIDSPERCYWLKDAHGKLHEAARSIREAHRDLYKDLKVYKRNVQTIEKQIREKEEKERRREIAKKIVAKRLAGKGVGRG